MCSTHVSTTPSPKSTAEFLRRAEREATLRLLIGRLRDVAFLATKLANDTPGAAERARLAQITARCDAELRRLCNKKEAA